MPDRTRQKPPDKTRKRAPAPEASPDDEIPLVPPKVSYPGQAEDKPVPEPGPQPHKRQRGRTERMHIL